MKKLIVLLAFVLFAWGFVWVNNNWIQTTEYKVASERVPKGFEGAKIVQISDLHNATFGKNQSFLIKKVEAANPDVIFLTGDLIDSNRYDLQTSLTLVDALVKMSEVYFVLGNHEVAINEIDEITEALEARGVKVLMNEATEWERNGETIQVAGINDPLMNPEMHEDELVHEALAETKLTDSFTLLLAHRPEVFNAYAEENVDVVFSGHAHGGQMRIPGIGGLWAPGQGWFPELTKGVFEKNNTQLVLSRGLGNSEFPLRIFNLPEIVVVTLEKE
ncbi:metallophosphoesterase [Planococcus sp. N028]|uniref:Metallophosphoesterase n=1 Tax=Planococcus shixiaomingii TaxID=3058393 RepID=A0ABT8N2A5_9BACL|nr:metallophosphoesterase [Planococcus sp. N028]MDN7242024.1 metallophosphoesterase [Planococcus sp. N028]